MGEVPRCLHDIRYKSPAELDGKSPTLILSGLNGTTPVALNASITFSCVHIVLTAYSTTEINTTLVRSVFPDTKQLFCTILLTIVDIGKRLFMQMLLSILRWNYCIISTLFHSLPVFKNILNRTLKSTKHYLTLECCLVTIRRP